MGGGGVVCSVVILCKKLVMACAQHWLHDYIIPQGVHYSLKPRITCVHVPCIRFIFAKIKQYTYKSHCFKQDFHTYTRVQKKYKNCI